MRRLFSRSEGRGTARPVLAEIHRQPVAVAADWQLTVAEWIRKERSLHPGVVEFLKSTGVLSRCCFLASTDGGPLVMRHLAAATTRIFGLPWARQQLGKPHVDDLHAEYAAAIDRQYREAMEIREPIYNRLSLEGVGPAPIVYSHMLFGWTCGHRRAVLSAVDCVA
jgi:hypothetical protein